MFQLASRSVFTDAYLALYRRITYDISSFRRQVLQTFGHEMILKARVADSEDPDYIEIELPGDSLTLDTLILVASTELGIEASSVDRVRRMPNTR